MSEPIQRLEEALLFAERRAEDIEARLDALERTLRAAISRIATLEAARDARDSAEEEPDVN